MKKKLADLSMRSGRDFRRPARCFVLAIAAFVVAACSVNRLGYELAPTAALWQIERYVTISDAQRQRLRTDLADLHHWHRTTQLTRYARLLREVDDGMRAPVDARQVGRWREEVVDWWLPLADRLAPGVVAFGRTLDPVQLATIRRRWEESEREHREGFRPDDRTALLEARARRLEKRAEFFLGDLEPSQQALVERLAAGLPDTEAQWLDERTRRGARLVALLEWLAARDEPADVALEHARRVLRDLFDGPAPANADAIRAATAAADVAYAEILASATESQRATMRRKLRGWIADTDRLSAG